MNERSYIDFDLSPFIVIWEVTQSCDLACLHCRANARTCRDLLELTTCQGYNLLDDIKEFGSPLLVFTGGDPLKREDIFDLIAYGVGKGLRTTVFPSVSQLLTNESIRMLKDAGLSRMAVSLDGSTPELRDSFRGIKGSFARTLEVLSECAAEGIPLQINTTVTKYNVSDFDNIANLISSFKLVLWSVFFLVPSGRGRVEDGLTTEEYESVFERMYEISKVMPYDVKSTEAPHYRRYAAQANAREKRTARCPLVVISKNKQDLIGRAPRGINDGRGFVFISHTGEVYPSGFLLLSGGNVKNESIVAIYRNSPLFIEIRDYDGLKGKCGVCEFKNIWGGLRARSYAVTGDFMESEPYCVNIPKKYEARQSDEASNYPAKI
ncbi:MAG: TIGR04053 family radical SAM/SPASM domain-containing protein [Thermodesulfobacteriota bacterium]